MWTTTDPKSSSTQCDAGVPSRPIGLVFSSRSGPDDAVRDGVELALRAARADDEVVGQRRQGGQVEQDDVGGLLVLGELDDAAGELERRPLGLGRGRPAVRQPIGARGDRRCGGSGRGRRPGLGPGLGRARRLRRRLGPGLGRGLGVGLARVAGVVADSVAVPAGALRVRFAGSAGSVTIGHPSWWVGTAHGRRYSRRPHPGTR